MVNPVNPHISSEYNKEEPPRKKIKPNEKLPFEAEQQIFSNPEIETNFENLKTQLIKHIKVEDLELAKAVFEQLLKFHQDLISCEILNPYGRLLRKKASLEESEKIFKEEAERQLEKAAKHPDGESDLSTISHYGECLRQQGKLNEAQRQLEKATKLPGGESHLFTISSYGECLR